LRFNIVLDDVSITHVAFSPEFTHAVEAKQVLAFHPSSRSYLDNVCLGGATNGVQGRVPCRSSHSREAGALVASLARNLFLSGFFQSIIVRAQGEARAAELIGEALRSNKGFLQLRRLEAARDIANLLSTSGNRLMLDSQSLLLNGQ
jgi:prohibitin 2